MTLSRALLIAALALTPCLAQAGEPADDGPVSTAAPGGAAPPLSDADRNYAAAQAFMATNAKVSGVTTTPSGLQYRINKSGPAEGEKPGLSEGVQVNYEGTLTSGEVFDSTYRSGRPAVFGVAEVVPGWTEVLQLMRPGDEWVVYLPPDLGYGPRRAGPIPPNSVLVFRMELLRVLKAPAQ